MVNINGYNGIYMPNHHRAFSNGCVYEHILVAESKLGRELNDGEQVHHIDRNRKNNHPDNLLIFKSNSDHIAFHSGAEIRLEGDVYVAIKIINRCDRCGIILKHKTTKYCIECSKIIRRSNMPDKDTLCSDILGIGNMCAIGRKYNVSDNAVRKWCKLYGLPYNKHDIDNFRKERKNEITI